MLSRRTYHGAGTAVIVWRFVLTLLLLLANLCHGWIAATTLPVSTPTPTSSILRSQRYIPDLTVIDDDDGDDDDDDQGDTQRERYAPPDFSVVEDDGETGDISASVRSSRGNADNEIYEDKSTSASTDRRRRVVRRTRSMQENASWMQRNKAFVNQADETEDEEGEDDSSTRKRSNRTFRQDFRGTRVFVQNLPPHANWQSLKDHFRMAGTVVFASVSADVVTGQSKGHGVVQYETTEMAQHAIRIMRNFPLDGYQLYVREDVQEKTGLDLGHKMPSRGRTQRTEWTCANEENAAVLSEHELETIRTLVKARDDARRRRQFDAADKMREELRFEYNVHVDDRLKMWWTAMDGNQVPQPIRDIKGEGGWKKPKLWRQIPTTPENDACVNPDLVNALLEQRDIARKEKDFSTADALLEEARTSPDGELTLRIHDESRTWRIWTDAPPPRPVSHARSPTEQCIELVQRHAPEKLDEIQQMLQKFPGREYNILKKLKQRYGGD